MRFVDVYHDKFNGTDGKNYPDASCSFILDLYLHIVVLKQMLNNNTRGSGYNAVILEDILKADYNFNFPKNKINIISDTKNAATKVAKYFSEDSEQANCEVHQLNSSMKYG